MSRGGAKNGILGTTNGFGIEGDGAITVKGKRTIGGSGVAGVEEIAAVVIKTGKFGGGNFAIDGERGNGIGGANTNSTITVINKEIGVIENS